MFASRFSCLPQQTVSCVGTPGISTIRPWRIVERNIIPTESGTVSLADLGFRFTQTDANGDDAASWFLMIQSIENWLPTVVTGVNDTGYSNLGVSSVTYDSATGTWFIEGGYLAEGGTLAGVANFGYVIGNSRYVIGGRATITSGSSVTVSFGRAYPTTARVTATLASTVSEQVTLFVTDVLPASFVLNVIPAGTYDVDWNAVFD